MLDAGVCLAAELAGPDATVILMSDHGFGPIHKFVNFNIWLLEQGFLKLKGDPPTASSALYSIGIRPPVLGYKVSMQLGFANLPTVAQGMSNRNALLESSAPHSHFPSIMWIGPNKHVRLMGNCGQIMP